MKRKTYIFGIILLVAASLLNIYYLDKRIKNIQAKEQLLNDLLLDAYSKIKQAGGLVSVDYPVEFDSRIKIAPSDFSGENNKSLLSEAIENMTGALKIDGSGKEIYYYLARAYMGSDDLENAEKYFNLDIEKGSQNENSYNTLWALLVQKKGFDDATVVAEKFLKKYPDRLDEYYVFRSLIEAKRENYKEALYYGQLLVEVNKCNYPTEAYANHQFLADIYDKIGEQEKSNQERQLAEKAKEDYIALRKSK